MINFFENEKDIKAYFTTRDGGVSVGEFTSLNMGFNTADENVIKNRDIVVKSLGTKVCEIIPTQVHKTDIALIDEALDQRIFVGEYDALVTKRKNVLLTTCHADCLAVYLYDKENKVIGLAHAGWKGTLGKIAVKTLQKMCKELGANEKTTIAAISPGISKCCFEVGTEVYEAFKENLSYVDNYTVKKENGKYNLDLKGINLKQLHDCGITGVELSPYCTSCNTDMFFSHRKEKGKTGRMCAGIVMID